MTKLNSLNSYVLVFHPRDSTFCSNVRHVNKDTRAEITLMVENDDHTISAKQVQRIKAFYPEQDNFAFCFLLKDDSTIRVEKSEIFNVSVRFPLY